MANKAARVDEQVRAGLQDECGVPMTEDSTRMWRLLGGLGSHDLSLMREALGMPEKVIGAALLMPVWK